MKREGQRTAPQVGEAEQKKQAPMVIVGNQEIAQELARSNDSVIAAIMASKEEQEPKKKTITMIAPSGQKYYGEIVEEL